MLISNLTEEQKGRALLRMAKSAFALKKFDLAKNLFEKILKSDPKSTEAQQKINVNLFFIIFILFS